MPQRDNPCSHHGIFCILPLLFIFLSCTFIDIARSTPISSPSRLEVNGFDIKNLEHQTPKGLIAVTRNNQDC